VLRDPTIDVELYPGVYAPAEDTALLLSALEVRKGERALEMGCGSGLISLHMAKAGAVVTAVDLDDRAVGNALRNAELNGLRIKVLQSDLFERVRGSFDLLVFNPPYLRGRAEGADDLCWAGGEDGVHVTARFLREAGKHLAPGGRVLMLLSSDMDEGAVDRALEGWRWTVLSSRTLFFERLRVLELTF
jgi:release factor glutamine methyltransferase